MVEKGNLIEEFNDVKMGLEHFDQFLREWLKPVPTPGDERNTPDDWPMSARRITPSQWQISLGDDPPGEVPLGYVEALPVQDKMSIRCYDLPLRGGDRHGMAHVMVERLRDRLREVGALSVEKPGGSVAGESDEHHDSGHYKYSPEDRRRIVEEYRQARKKSLVTNKDAWAKMRYDICRKTLLSYEREFPEGEA